MLMLIPVQTFSLAAWEGVRLCLHGGGFSLQFRNSTAALHARWQTGLPRWPAPACLFSFAS